MNPFDPNPLGVLRGDYVPVDNSQSGMRAMSEAELEAIAKAQSAGMRALSPAETVQIQGVSEPGLDEWIIGSKPRPYDDIHEFELWIYGEVRRARRVGNKSMSITPGTLVFTDCRHPLANAICDPGRIDAWRIRIDPKEKV